MLIDSIEKKSVSFGELERDVFLITVEKEQGIMLARLAEIFGVSRQNISQIIKRQNLRTMVVSDSAAVELRKAGVIPLSGKRGTFVPKDSVQVIVKFVGTQRAIDFFKQVWGIALEMAQIATEQVPPALSKSPAAHLQQGSELIELRLALSELKTMAEVQSLEIEELKAKLEAASGYIISKAGKRRNVHVIVEYLSIGQDIWRKPAYQAFVTKKTLDDMSHKELSTYTLQHSARTYKGLSYRIAECIQDLRIANPAILRQSEQLVESAHNLLEEIMPSQRRLQLVSEERC